MSNAGKCAFSIAYTASEGDEEDMEEEETGTNNPVDPQDYYQLAADYFTQYLAYNSSDTSIVDRVASVYLYQLRDCANGVKYYQQLLAMDPNNCEANRALGYAYFLEICSKDYSKAINHFLKAQNCLAASGGECQDKDLVLAIAKAYHLRAVDKAEKKQSASDDYRNANTWYKKCLKCDPNNKDAKDGVEQTEYEF